MLARMFRSTSSGGNDDDTTSSPWGVEYVSLSGVIDIAMHHPLCVGSYICDKRQCAALIVCPGGASSVDPWTSGGNDLLGELSTNRVKEVCVHFAYFPLIKNSPLTSLLPIFINIQPINKMPSKPVTDRRRLSPETRVSILALREGGKSFGEIADQLKLTRSTVTTIVHRAKRQLNASPASKKRMGRPPKLNDREKRAFIRHIDRNPHDNLAALATPSKSGHQLSKPTVRKYMRGAGFLRFRARRKPYLTVRHKAARLIWARKHKH